MSGWVVRSTGVRRVVVLSAEPETDLEAVFRRAARDASEVLMLSLGSEPTEQQKVMVRTGLNLAADLRVAVQARLVLDIEEARAQAQNAREIIIAASGTELRRLEAAFLPKHPPIPGVAAWSEDHRTGEATTDTSPDDYSSNGTESVEALAGRSPLSAKVKTFWTAGRARQRKSGHLRIYLGAAPGVGKTFAMLGEGQRRRSRGTDVVVGLAETYGRPLTTEMLTGLEVIPRRRLLYREAWFEEMDRDAILDRGPAVALVDELAHTNVPGSARAKRWEDVLDLLSDGIEVISTLNIQHLESLNDVIAGITGIRQQETVPDWVVDIADQIELVDMSPEALRRRMQHGNVYPDPQKSELALHRFFTLENLTALRELALMRVANRVDADLLERWTKQTTPQTRERILVCVGEKELAEDLIRRGARMAQRLHGDLLVLHVKVDQEMPEADWGPMEALANDLGARFQTVEADSVVKGIVDFAAEQRITQCVLGEPLRPHWQEILRGSTVNRVIRQASDLDVHVIARRSPNA